MTIIKKKLQRIGNSTGLVLPADVLTKAGMSRDDEVILHVEDGRVTVSKVDTNFDECVALADDFIAQYANALTKLAQ